MGFYKTSSVGFKSQPGSAIRTREPFWLFRFIWRPHSSNDSTYQDCLLLPWGFMGFFLEATSFWPFWHLKRCREQIRFLGQRSRLQLLSVLLGGKEGSCLFFPVLLKSGWKTDDSSGSNFSADSAFLSHASSDGWVGSETRHKYV